MLDHSELREIMDNIKNKKDDQCINFITKHPVARIYEKIGQTECQLVVNTGVEVLFCIKSIADLLKLKPKANKTITVVAIDRIKQKSLESVGIVTVKVMN